MRKSYQLVASLLLLTMCVGCSCSNDKYKFYSFTNDNQTYKCSSNDKKDDEVERLCDSFQDFSIVLKSKDKAIINMPSISINNEETNYKIEDGYFYIKDNGSDEFYRLGSHSDNEIKVTVGSVTITLRK